jgi:hypothetical protein
MSLSANIDHLQIASGIQAVCVLANEERDYRGEQRWHPVLDQALNLFALTDQATVRLVVGDHTVVVQRERDQVAAVALPTGHPIAKSLRRMIRRMAKKARGPLPVSQPTSAPSRPGTPAAAVGRSSSSLLF